jgi:hypothetical protein
VDQKEKSANILTDKGMLTVPRQNATNDTTNETGEEIKTNHAYFVDTPGAVEALQSGDTATNAISVAKNQPDSEADTAPWDS